MAIHRFTTGESSSTAEKKKRASRMKRRILPHDSKPSRSLDRVYIMTGAPTTRKPNCARELRHKGGYAEMSGFGFSSSSNGGASKISNMNDQALIWMTNPYLSSPRFERLQSMGNYETDSTFY
uniref:Uncharacterized protein n=1 Tax=Pristionchus pacificus TaxID=54126 RepID=A0A2A6BG33_PRIPA|eukprot:PDM64816.1 hypothetical protein PRIPAC_53072 [Pristionchus pacificus]